MSSSKSGFFDSQTILAVVLVGGVFIGWQTYMQHKYPDAFKPKTEESLAAPDQEKPSASPSDAKAQEQAPVSTPEGVAVEHLEVTSSEPERTIAFESENLSFEISSRGMGLKNIVINKFKNRNGQPVVLGVEADKGLTLETRALGSSAVLDFKIERLSENSFVGRARVGNVTVTKSIEVDAEKYDLKVKVAAAGEDKQFIGIVNILAENVEKSEGKSMFSPQNEVQEFFVKTSETKDRIHFSGDDVEKVWNKGRVVAVGSQYFSQALVDHSDIMPEVKGNLDHKSMVATLMLEYPALNSGAEPLKLNYLAFIGPKYFNLLQSIDPDLGSIVDFGFFDYIGRHILGLLRWFHSWMGNWGWAVIGLTLLVRVILLPINMYSYKSMKAMQVIQPQIKELRERYKDDQQKQQQEMMALMKTNKVNPVGGCLPIFLQFPIFIALYQVLGHSIELYQAPFALWIHDLSLKDPIYVLPVLMGATMFVQQKITPNTMDPAQAKVLLMMPVLFSFFMLSLPSGLTLYMLVGAVFSVAQQMYFMRGQTPAT